MTDKASAIAFLAAAGGFAISLVVGGATGNLVAGIRFGAVCFTAAFIALAMATFISGNVRIGNLLNFDRQDDPKSFYTVALTLITLSLILCAIFLWLAFRA